MKKLLITAIVLASVVSLCAVAETTDKERGYISVTASSTQEIAPNQAELSISIETSDKSLQIASESNQKIANVVYASLKQLIGRMDYIKTNTYSARPQYIYTKDNKKVFDKYIVTNTVVVKTKSPILVPKLIDTAISKGATGVDNLQFSVTDFDSACNDNLAELTKEAYARATTVAKSINSQIAGIKSIDTSCNAENSPRPYYGMMASDAMAKTSATPIESGKIKIYANVNAAFYVK